MKVASKAEEVGRQAASKWEMPPCPYDPGSADQVAWLDGLIEGRKSFAWNTRNGVQAGSTARWLSEAVSQELGIALGKSVIGFGAEMAIFFRIGFLLNSLETPVPTMPAEDWRRFAMVVNRGMQGRTFDEMKIAEPTWLERLAWKETRSFVHAILEGKNAPSDASKCPAFTCELQKLIAWMGSTATRPDWMPESKEA